MGVKTVVSWLLFLAGLYYIARAVYAVVMLAGQGLPAGIPSNMIPYVDGAVAIPILIGLALGGGLIYASRASYFKQ
jgi:hypothetical protein